MISNSFPQREETLKRRRKQKRIKYAVFVLAILILLGLVSYASHLPKVRINEVVLKGGLLVTQKEIKEESLKHISGSYFWLFPKSNAFIYPKNSLEDDLKNKFKRIDTIKIYLEGLNTMIVEITERKPVAIWCNNLGGEEDKCYFIDQNSTVFAEAPDFSGDVYFKYYGLLDKDSPIGKEYIASSTEFTQINNFINLVKSLKIKPLHLIAKEEGEFSLALYGGGEIFFDVKKSFEVTFQNLETLLKSPDLSLSGGYLPVEYIDLRYGNKLFYKLK